jgi:hypothetical protein
LPGFQVMEFKMAATILFKTNWKLRWMAQKPSIWL